MAAERSFRLLGIALLLLGGACQGDGVPSSAPAGSSSQAVTGAQSSASARAARRRPRRPPRRASSARSKRPDRPKPTPFRRAELATLRAPDKIACRFETKKWRPPRDVKASLRIHPKAPPFAHITTGALRLLVPEGASQDAIVEVTREGITIRGRVRVDDLESSGKPRHRRSLDKPFVLRPNRPFALGGVVAVTSETKVAWRGARKGHLTLTLPESRLRWAQGVELEHPCEDLSLDPWDFENTAERPVLPEDAPKRYLRMGHPIALRADAYGQTVANLRLPSGENEARELERSGGRVRIFMEHDDEAIFGWVATRELLDDELGALMGMGALGMQGIGDGGWGALEPTRPSMAECVCQAEVPIVVDMSQRAPHPDEHDANYAAVGVIPARKSFRVQKGDEPLWRLYLRGVLKGVRMTRGRFAVFSGDVESCACTQGRRGF